MISINDNDCGSFVDRLFDNVTSSLKGMQCIAFIFGEIVVFWFGRLPGGSVGFYAIINVSRS